MRLQNQISAHYQFYINVFCFFNQIPHDVKAIQVVEPNKLISENVSLKTSKNLSRYLQSHSG